ncbi:serine hydrolase domain-containing protein [Streptomyces sp. NPDC059009]|uniref:serine hydrolase domain-containing protein n=1 Tax=Streptomyces sp. NPDC059009 TaxID=3346694 RepID=UPI0036C32FE4
MSARTGTARGLAATAVAAAVTAALAAPAAQAQSAGSAGAHGPRPHEATQRALAAAVGPDAPGATAQAVDKNGVWKGASGTGDLATGAPRGADDHFRVGSVTKSFVATVLLQLQGEGEIDLDDTVGKWLPGVVKGHGHDGDGITVRQLLNHTSGVFNVSADPEFRDRVFSERFLKHRYDTWTPEQMVSLAMRHKPDFAPGQGWKYSNTNYVLAGMIIKKVTGHDYGDEIERRVIKPLGLRATSLPGTDPTVPAPSSRGYKKLSDAPGATLHDLTEFNPTVAGSAGSMISDSADLNRFYRALLGGRLLPKKQLAEMKTTVPAGEGGRRYGLGLEPVKLSCGPTFWGHGGDVHGASTLAGTTADGRHALTLNLNGDIEQNKAFAVVEAEFCAK